MTALSDFSASEYELLVSLPYKVGVYVSHAEDEDGEGDDEKEMAALERCIQAIVRLHEDKPFTAEIVNQTLSMKTDWPRWSARSFAVPDEVSQAAALLRGKASKSERDNYCAALMEIASMVAQAFGEFGDDEDEDAGVFGKLLGKITDGFSSLKPGDGHNPMNISAAEDTALETLRMALKGEDV